MVEQTIKAEDLPEHARVHIQGGLRGHTLRVTYGKKEVVGITAAQLTLKGAAVRTKALLEYQPAAAVEKKSPQLREDKEVEVESVDVEAVVQGVEESAEIHPRELAPDEQLESADVPVGDLTEEERAALQEAGGVLAELADEVEE